MIVHLMLQLNDENTCAFEVEPGIWVNYRQLSSRNYRAWMNQVCDSSLAKYALYAESHDRVDYVVVVLFQCLDSLVPRDTCLGHDQLDILVFQSGSVNLLTIVFILILLAIATINSFTLAVVVGVVVASVIMSGVVMGLLRGQLLSGRDLGLGVEILDLGFAEDAV